MTPEFDVAPKACPNCNSLMPGWIKKLCWKCSEKEALSELLKDPKIKNNVAYWMLKEQNRLN
jgi:hypothetical protein|tara:strand:- start:1303 stop:1488 length:186 start_codon:yes stop_codon:yes gene_type:complete